MTHVLIRCVYHDHESRDPIAVGDESAMLALKAGLEAIDKDTKGADPSVIYEIKKVPDARNRHITARSLLSEL